ncbi:MAG TPA: glycosyltransferase family 4 protein [Candidatus Omnitrophota bacterium]|nr:glycosyltransferase family 4 protein [Candidatus Omnitrophota bacterium]
MKILIGHNRYQFEGGEDAVVASEQRLLGQHGQEVVSYRRDNRELSSLSPLRRLFTYLNIGWSRVTYREVRSILKRERPDIAHFHNVHFMMTPSVYYACQEEGVPVVQSLHNFRMFCANALFFRDNMVCEDCLKIGVGEGIRHKCYKNSRLATTLVTRMMQRHHKQKTWLNQINAYICASEFTKRKYIEGGIPGERIFVKPNFAESYSYKLKEHKDYALYMGRLSQEKGLDVLLEAYRLLAPLPLKIAGEGPMREQINRFIEEHHLKNIEILGFTSHEAWEDLMSQAKFAVVPSRCYENFPRIVSESFSFGLPVVASRLGSLRELVKDKENGVFFTSGDSQDLAQKIKWMYEEADLKSLRQNARRTFEEKYAPEKNYQELISIYERVIARHQSKAEVYD